MSTAKRSGSAGMRVAGWCAWCVCCGAATVLLGAGCAADNNGAARAAGRDGGEAVTAKGREAGRGNVEYAMAFPTGDRESSAVLLQVEGPKSVRVGQRYDYSLRVTNLTDEPLHDVKVWDLAPAQGDAPSRGAAARGDGGRDGARQAAARQGGGGATPGGAEAAGDAPADGGRSTWDVGTLAPGQSKAQQFNAVADEVGTVNNCLVVSYQPTLCFATRVVQPNLRITKTGPSDVLRCEEIVYTYTVANVGSGVAQDVRVIETLPEGLTPAEGEGDRIEIPVGDLPAGQQKQVQARIQPRKTGRFATRAVARSEGDEAQSRPVVTRVLEPRLEIAVEGPEAEYAGQLVQYRVTVRNTGDGPARDAVLLLAADEGRDPAERPLGAIPAGESRVARVTMTAPRQAGDLALRATADAFCAETATDRAVVQIRTIPALQLEVIDGTDPVKLGQNTVYTIVVTNEGTGPATNVTLRATMPEGMQFVRGGGQSEVQADGADLTFAPIRSLPPGGQARWTVEAKAQRAGDVQFRLQLNSDTLDRPAIESEPTKLYNPQDPAAGADDAEADGGADAAEPATGGGAERR